MNSPLSFDNTAIAFANKSDKELKQAHWLFGLMGKPWLVQVGTRLAPWSIRAGLPVKGIIRKTIFRQFVGGETLDETATVAARLAASNVQVILDYGVEGKEGEESFELACQEFIRVIDYAATQPNIPYMSIKVTGFARFALLERLDSLMATTEAPSLVKRYEAALALLSEAEAAEWRRVADRMERISTAAVRSNVGVLVDAEETWIQDPVDALTMIMMDRYNRDRVVLYNTIQLYRHDRLAFLKQSVDAARERGFVLGAKLVRGAYMEKERKRAQEMGYPSPIQPTKESSDRDYDAAVRLCMDQLDVVAVIIASHNEHSNALGVQLLREKGLPMNHPRVHFSQLFGMSDNITYNLAGAGCSVSKYLPFGPIGDVVPYLMRRAQENTSVGGQTGRELMLLQREMKRRGM
ncbi:proline dehydrogenase family protein [Flaviaesturariibacter amylovorans]|uniref:Proline dehydrogenase family protein n=1 Tax=Flaviaesturariibacter amylovorans TaxID=1084520 RepID=A0ABP8GMI7_9BACT